MKTSAIIIAALFLNTTLLVAEPLATFVKGVSPFVFIGIETFLVLGYLINQWIKELNKACTINLGYLKIFVIDSK